MPGPHHRRREYAGPDAVAEALLNPAWSHLEPPSPASKRSGLTSSDDAPRYRRGSKRRPKPPKTPPGLVQPLRDSVALARFPGKGLGYAAIEEIPATTMLFQERPLKIAGAFADAEEARRALARAMAGDARYARLGVGSSSASSNVSNSTNASQEPSPFTDEGIDDASWNDALGRARRDAFVRRAKKGELERLAAYADGASSDFTSGGRVVVTETSNETSVRSETENGENKNGVVPNDDSDNTKGVTKEPYVAHVFAHVSLCNHSCRPNAAVSVGDTVTTLYSLRAICPGEEIVVSYASSLLWLPVHARRAQLAKHWGFLCKCPRCDEELARAAAERDRGVGATKAQASRFGARRAGGVDSRAAREAERDAGFRAWEYGETGFEGQFDDEGRLRSADESRSNESRSNDDRATDSRDARRRNRDGDGASSSDSDSTSSFSDSSDSDSDDADVIPSQRRSVGSNGSWRDRAGARKKKERGAVAVMGAARLYNKLSRAGIGVDHWQMHAVREALVSRLLSAEGRKDFDLDLLLEHANCAARLAPNHPHFVRLVTLVEEVFKSNRATIVAEQFWVWTIELLREAVHPDVLFWNTEFKGMPGGRERAVEGDEV